MALTRWNDEEDDALQGLSLLAQTLYLRGIRRFMAFDTGIAGNPGRSRGGKVLAHRQLADVARFVPDRGSKEPPWEPTKGEIRAALGQLKRAGLIEDRGSNKEDGFVFFLPLAMAGQSVQKRNDAGTTQERRSGSDARNAPRNPGAARVVEVGAQQGTTQERRSGFLEERSTTGIQDYRKDKPPHAPAREADLPDCVPVAEWRAWVGSLAEQGKPLTISGALAAVRDLVSLDADGYDPGKALRRAAIGGWLRFDRCRETRRDDGGPAVSGATVGHGALRKFDGAAPKPRPGNVYDPGNAQQNLPAVEGLD